MENFGFNNVFFADCEIQLFIFHIYMLTTKLSTKLFIHFNTKQTKKIPVALTDSVTLVIK